MATQRVAGTCASGFMSLQPARLAISSCVSSCSAALMLTPRASSLRWPTMTSARFSPPPGN
eukprot:2172091-Lingulodinium_polyedra.AAC.1